MSESISLATGTARLWRSPDHCPQAMSPPGQPLRSAYVVLKDSLASDLLSADGGQPSGRAGATPFLPLWPDDVRIHPEFDPGARRRQSVLGADDDLADGRRAARGCWSGRFACGELTHAAARLGVPVSSARLTGPPSWPVTCADVPGAGHRRRQGRGSHSGASGPPSL